MSAGRRSFQLCQYKVIKSIILAACVIIGPGQWGCSEHDHEHPQGHGQDAEQATLDPVVHVYPLRGRIVSLPDPADPASELRIHHEAIDDFKMGDESPAPMGAMKMPFTPSSLDALQGLAIGDAVAFEFHMQWHPSRNMIATAFEKLPADTKLNFENAGEADAGHEGH